MSSEPRTTDNNHAVIDVQHVSKAYRIYPSPADRFKQAFAWGRKQYFREFLALRDVSLHVGCGEMVGLIGRNGSGKSTLLQIIAGTLAATSGEVTVRGRVAALLELGSGFDHEATGAENIYMNGALLGLSRDEIVAKYDEIVAFADIGDFIDQPVKTYSSGMVVRLAFAVAAHVDARVLIVDEALSVGDAPFQAKCFRSIQRLRDQGVTILLATHDTTTMTRLCERALLLEHGQTVAYGPAKEVGEEYYRRVQELDRLQQSHEPSPAAATAGADTQALETPVPARDNRMGDHTAEIVGYAIFDHSGRRTRALAARQPFRVDLSLRFNTALQNPQAGFALRDVHGRILLGGHTLFEDVRLGPVQAGDQLLVSFEMPMQLNAGRYLLMLGVADHQTWTTYRDCDVFFDLCEIEVHGQLAAWGVVNAPSHITVRRA